MKLFKPLLTVLALAFALIFITACSSGGNEGFEVGITSLGDPDTIAAAVQKGNQELLDFINKDIEKLGKENFFHKAYEKTLHPTYGDAAKADDLVVEGGKVD
nr:hypothetical protein [Streptococcus pneumoniae]